ncbi:hypothetical protein EV195_1182 [Tenacibaculum skagerrakense]|uniref:Lipoprotein n=1 Tax=Tenacibaculum skagerrakense TaxID=186571 RepID=A0A4V2SL06_9FLAO|nr:hypothetical protein [Tenacibaculum skagerrakense]TCP21516.1 hypothetical protein EV195_1182 [Tenacibaculum skagerrakense]
MLHYPKTFELKKNIIILFTFLLLTSCNDGANYVSQNDGKTHLIDFDLFSIILPKDFKYKKIDGIDSFVGEIKNGKSKFIFDYGWYSPSPPMDEKSYIEENRKGMNFETTQKFFNKIDLKPYEDENGGVNPQEIVKKIRNLTLHKMTDSIATQNDFKSNCEYYYTFEFNKAEFKIPFCIPNEERKQFENYELTIDTIGNYIRTIALWNDKQNPNMSSVNFEPINKETDSNELFIGIKSNMEFDKSELKKIFKTVELK